MPPGTRHAGAVGAGHLGWERAPDHDPDQLIGIQPVHHSSVRENTAAMYSWNAG